MESSSGSHFRPFMLVCCVFLVSACATTTAGVALGDKTGATASDTIRKAESKTEPGITGTSDRIGSPKPVEQNQTVARIGIDKSGRPQNISARIPQQEKRVQVKSVASDKARTIARLQGGKQIEILEEKGNWLKIRWQDGEKTKKGWLNKRHVEIIP